MRKICVVLMISVLIISGCVSFGGFGEEPAEAAQTIVEELSFRQARAAGPSSTLINKKISYMVAVFDVEPSLRGEELDEEARKEFQQLIYSEYKRLYKGYNYFSPEEIEAKEKELGPDIGKRGYEYKQRTIAKALGADYVIVGKMRANGLGGWDMAIKLLETGGAVVVTLDEVTYKG